MISFKPPHYIKYSHKDKFYKKLSVFQCFCGAEFVTKDLDVARGRVKSCGCFRSKFSTNVKHGLSKTVEYKTWRAMLRRCYNKKCEAYRYYGERGIMVCEEWWSFDTFLLDMGKRPAVGLSLDRINNNGNYEPGNCRWATSKEQANNKRNSTKKCPFHP